MKYMNIVMITIPHIKRYGKTLKSEIYYIFNI
jgi:hypothetical protein